MRKAKNYKESLNAEAPEERIGSNAPEIRRAKGGSSRLIRKNSDGEKEINSAHYVPDSEINIAPLTLPCPVGGESFENPIWQTKSEIKKMEVHHHPEVEKKGFKEYLLEGLMIFLAVLMGFVAENFRESASEHSRAKEFAASYYDDLKKDSTALQAALKFSNNKIASLDSGLTNLQLPEKEQNDTLLYREFSVGSVVVPFDPSEGTYEQIKSSGSLRYFKQRMASLMNDYDVQVKKTVKREDIDLKFTVEQYFPFFIKNYNAQVVYDDRYLHHISHELYFEGNKENIRQLINYIVIIKLERFRAIEAYKRQIKTLNAVMTELRKEYDPE